MEEPSYTQPRLAGLPQQWPGVQPEGWQRVLLKLSGEAFAGPDGGLGVDPDVVHSIAGQIAQIVVRDFGKQLVAERAFQFPVVAGAAHVPCRVGHLVPA